MVSTSGSYTGVGSNPTSSPTGQVNNLRRDDNSSGTLVTYRLRTITHLNEGINVPVDATTQYG
jgi:hypothetical protein